MYQQSTRSILMSEMVRQATLILGLAKPVDPVVLGLSRAVVDSWSVLVRKQLITERPHTTRQGLEALDAHAECVAVVNQFGSNLTVQEIQAVRGWPQIPHGVRGAL